MLFNSWTFVAFASVVFAGHYALAARDAPARAQVLLLLLASLCFYAWDRPSLVLLLLGSVAGNVAIARRIAASKASHAWLWAGVSMNLALLATFKYAALLTDLLLPTSVVARLPFEPTSVPLPVGISFYTFQAISLLVDLRADRDPALRRLGAELAGPRAARAALDVGFYIAFFPQLVAGPIVKAASFFGQIGRKRLEDIHWGAVTGHLVTGFFLKMVVADNLKDVTALLTSEHLRSLGRLDLVFLLYGYSFQIFADFAGYSLIAIGLGLLFGYRFPINFNYPYVATSFGDFWRRWHISLSSFLREYLYVPLGGNRRGAVRTYFNLAIVMVLGGLWHGAAWSYAVWGAAHGLLLALERLASAAGGARERRPAGPFSHAARALAVFHVVSALWLLFLMPDIRQVWLYVTTLATTPTLLASPQNVYVVALFGAPIMVYHVAALVREHACPDARPARWREAARVPMLAAMLALIVLNSGTPGTFVYFQF